MTTIAPKNKIMKTKLALLMALGLTLPAITFAQDKPQPRDGERPQPRDGERPPRREGAQRGDGQRPPVPPLIAALDLNHDGVIDADEIAKASESLKKLDKNGDGKLTMEELRPPRPEGAPEGGPQDGPPRHRFNRDGGPDGERQPPGEGQRPQRRGPPPEDKE